MSESPRQVAADDQVRAAARTTVRAMADVLRAHLRVCPALGCVGPDLADAINAMPESRYTELLAAALFELAGDDPRGEPDVEVVIRRG